MKRLLTAWVATCLACATLPPAERARRAVESGTSAKARNDLDAAAAAFDEALTAEPNNVTALRGQVESYHRLGRLGELEVRYRAALAANPADGFAHAALGLAAYAAGGRRGEEARTHLVKATELASEVADFHYRLGVLLVESDAFAEARTSLARAVELDPKTARYRIPYAVTLVRTGARREGVAELAAVLTLRPTHGDVDLAERTARSILDPFRNFPAAAREQFGVAFGFLEADNPTQARTVLDALVERFPDVAAAHALAGLCAARLDDAGRAIAEFRRATELDPDLAEPRLYLGDVYLSRGRPTEAREHYEAALARNPFLPDAWRRLAEVHTKAGEKEEAAAKLGSYLLLRPGDLETQVLRATTLGELGKAEAGEAWDGAVKLFPRRPETLVGHAKYWFSRAVASQDNVVKRQAGAKSRRSIETVVEVDPENMTASAMLAELNRLGL